MNHMGDKHQYHPYHRTNNADKNLQQSYKDYHSSSSSSCQHHDGQFNKIYSTNFSNQQPKTNDYSYSHSGRPRILIVKKPVRESTSFSVIPHERQSWIRSVKKTNVNESTEQKTQYLETILRMPQQQQQQQQQKSSINSSTFDRIRFANDQTSSTANITDNQTIFKENSYNLINNINNDDEICAIETIISDDELESTNGTSSTQIINCRPIVDMNSDSSAWSGFLIDNCDEVVQSSPISPPSVPSIPATIEKTIPQNQEPITEQERARLVYEFDAADTERKRLNRQKRARKRLQKKNRSKTTGTGQNISQLTSNSNVNNKNHQELSSDWIIEYDVTETDHISQLTNAVKEATKTMTNEDKIEKMNVILKKIQQQQSELRKLRQHVLSMLDEEQKSTNKQQNTDTNQDILMRFIDHQPSTSGCWLCSGKAFTEVAIQCDSLN